MTPTRYTIELRAVPGRWLTPPEQRLRAALKRLLRNYGLRCTRCQPVAPDEAERKMGEMLAATERAKGSAGAGRPALGGARTLPPKPETPTLAALGISKRESAEAQTPEHPRD
jgi:hypothetical protein